MDVKGYKTFHEECMSNNNGTSVEENVILLSTVPLCIFLSSFFSFWVSKSVICVFEFLVIVLPVILNCTILADVNHIIFLILTLICFFIIITQTDISSFKTLLSTEIEGKKSFVSNYRASTNFVSAVCILAVDFMVFPKRLAKTESFGFGFMDLGVGFFICSNGFVEKQFVAQVHFNKLLKAELILFGLGVIRVLSVKSIAYHEHVSEYGVHWNFFFTLALCRLISFCIIVLTKNLDSFYLSLIIGFVHQVLLLLGFQEWVLSHSPRDSVLDANKEGLVSCLGYISLYFSASSMGKYVLNLKNSVYKVLLKKLFLLCILMWLGTAISVMLFGISRRLVNISYIFWILALSLTELILFVIIEIIFKSLKRNTEARICFTVPTILECINAHGLFFFIFSNLLTGFVNLVFQTLLIEKSMSMIIIVSYMMILCSATKALFSIKGFSNFYFAENKKN